MGENFAEGFSVAGHLSGAFLTHAYAMSGYLAANGTLDREIRIGFRVPAGFVEVPQRMQPGRVDDGRK